MNSRGARNFRPADQFESFAGVRQRRDPHVVPFQRLGFGPLQGPKEQCCAWMGCCPQDGILQDTREKPKMTVETLRNPATPPDRNSAITCIGLYAVLIRDFLCLP